MIMKKQLLLLVMMLLPMVAWAYDFMVGGIRYNILSATNKTVEVTYDHISGAATYGEYSGSITVPAEVTYNNIIFKVTQIGHNAFDNCGNLFSLYISEGITSIGSKAVGGSLSSSVREIYIPNSVTKMGKSALSGNWSLTKVHLPENIQALPEELFMMDKALNTVDLPINIEEIPALCFENCESLNNINIPPKVHTINSSAFAGCKNLASITIPKNVKKIESGTFSGCSSLEEIHFHRSNIICGNYSFKDCSNLKNIFVHDTNVSGATLVFTEGTYLLATLYVPKGTKALYQNAKGWKNFSNIEESEAAGSEGTGETETKKCEMPTISYKNGQLNFACATDGVEFVSEITDSDIKKNYKATVTLTATYNISVYATKSGYYNSDVAKAILCWIDKEPATEGATDGISQIPSKAVLIQSEGGIISLQGIDDGTQISAYTADAKLVGTAISRNGGALLNTNLRPGTTAIVKIGEKSLKVIMK